MAEQAWHKKQKTLLAFLPAELRREPWTEDQPFQQKLFPRLPSLGKPEDFRSWDREGGRRPNTHFSLHVTVSHTVLPARPCCRTHTQALALPVSAACKSKCARRFNASHVGKCGASPYEFDLFRAPRDGCLAALVPPLPITPAAGGERRAGRPSAQGAAGGAEP